MRNKKRLLWSLLFGVLLGVFFGGQKIFAAWFEILDIKLLPNLDVSRFAPYVLQANVSWTVISGNVTIEGINWDGRECRDYLASGECVTNTTLTHPLVFSWGTTWVKTWVRPDHIYPQIFFMDNAKNWWTPKTNHQLKKNEYEILHYKNPFTMEGGMSFFIELNIAPISTWNSDNLDVYVVKKDKTIDFFKSDWLTNTGVERVASFSRLTTFNHSHGANSDHHLITLTTNADGTIWTNHVDVSWDFRIVTVVNTPATNKWWYLSYLPSTVCQNTNWRYVGTLQTRKTASQGWCPDLHVHVARRDDPIRDWMKATIQMSYLSWWQTIRWWGSGAFYFYMLPNLAPNATSFYKPIEWIYSGNIDISWYPASDVNNDPVTYQLFLLDSSWTELRSLVSWLSTTTFSWDSSSQSDWVYSLKGASCDNSWLCSTFMLPWTFQVDHSAPTLTEVSPIPPYTNQTTPTYIFNSTEAGIISYSWACSATTTTWVIWNNVVQFSALGEWTYSTCEIKVTDLAWNDSARLPVSPFTIYTTTPTASVTYDITWPTSGNIVATVTWFSREVTNLNAPTHTFTANGTFSFTFQDRAGNPWSVVASVNNIDTQAPQIHLSGSSNLNLYLHATYTELWASWTDNVDGVWTNISISWSVNTANAGTYILEYTYTDSAKNIWTAQRTINVLDSAWVLINILWPNPTFVEFGSPYNELWAVWTDPIDWSGTVLFIESTVNTGVVWTYSVKYTKVNTSWITWTATRSVIVQDTTPPQISLQGSTIVYVEFGDTYTEQWATRSDLRDGNGNVTDIVSTVNTWAVGTYTVTYTKTDTAWNPAIQKRTVIVQDTKIPTISLSSTNLNPTNQTIHMKADFSESIVWFTQQDILISNWVISNFTKISDVVYTFDVTPAQQWVQTIRIQPSTFQDIAWNFNINGDTFNIVYDTTTPTANELIYSITETTNQNVTVTIEWFSEPYTWLNAPSHTFTENGQFMFTFTDLAGNEWTATASVDRIDKTAPTVSGIVYSTTSPTNQNVIATVEAVGGELIFWTTTYTFTGNGDFTFTFTDLAGNTWTATANVTWIDKTAPTWTIVYSPATTTSWNVVATVTLNEPWTITNNGWANTYTFTENGQFIFTFTDSAGNTWTATASVTWIDKNNNIVDVTSTETQEIQTTWQVIFVWWTTTWVDFAWSGKILVGETGWSGLIEIVMNGLSIVASWDRNMILLAPSAVWITQLEKAEFGEPWVPAQTESTTSRAILNTVKAWSTWAELMAVWWANFKISFKVDEGTVWETLKVLRSNDWYAWENNTPDATCILDSNKLCTFYTDHLSYFATIQETVIQPSVTTPSQVGRAWWAWVAKDNCPFWDNSASEFDQSCVEQLANTKTEFEQAYEFAYKYGITTKVTLKDADMEWVILRIDLAKMITNYAIRVSGKNIDANKSCSFSDLQWLWLQTQQFAIQSCQLWLMWQNTNNIFNPFGVVTRAEFGTILSRLLRWEKYNTFGTDRYNWHLQALKENAIMKYVETPSMKELRWYVMLMLMRVSQSIQ